MSFTNQSHIPGDIGNKQNYCFAKKCIPCCQGEPPIYPNVTGVIADTVAHQTSQHISIPLDRNGQKETKRQTNKILYIKFQVLLVTCPVLPVTCH